MIINIKKLDPRAVVPVLATEGAAAVDLCALDDGYLRPGDRILVKTGLAFEIPATHVGLVCSRSGMALKNGVFVLNAPGVIDSDYRGDVGVILANLGMSAVDIRAGDRVAQFMVVPVTQCRYVTRDELNTTTRGAGGFGSTGS